MHGGNPADKHRRKRQMLLWLWPPGETNPGKDNYEFDNPKEPIPKISRGMGKAPPRFNAM